MRTITALQKKGKGDEWPSMSPDLNPIEYLWGILKRKVQERKVSNIHQLCDVIMEEGKRTPVATCVICVIDWACVCVTWGCVCFRCSEDSALV